MSFSFEFYAKTAADAHKILDTHYAPESVKDFVHAAIHATEGPVFVKAFGHLYQNDYTVSNATIEVRPVVYVDLLSSLSEQESTAPVSYEP